MNSNIFSNGYSDIKKFTVAVLISASTMLGATYSSTAYAVGIGFHSSLELLYGANGKTKYSGSSEYTNQMKSTSTTGKAVGISYEIGADLGLVDGFDASVYINSLAYRPKVGIDMKDDGMFKGESISTYGFANSYGVGGDLFYKVAPQLSVYGGGSIQAYSALVLTMPSKSKFSMKVNGNSYDIDNINVDKMPVAYTGSGYKLEAGLRFAVVRGGLFFIDQAYSTDEKMTVSETVNGTKTDRKIKLPNIHTTISGVMVGFDF